MVVGWLQTYIQQRLRPLTRLRSIAGSICLSLNRGKACKCNATPMHCSFFCLCIQCKPMQMQCNANAIQCNAIGSVYVLSLQQCAVYCIPNSRRRSCFLCSVTVSLRWIHARQDIRAFGKHRPDNARIPVTYCTSSALLGRRNGKIMLGMRPK